MEINDKKIRKIGRMLNGTMQSLLWGGCADPGSSELESSASCFEILKILDLEIKDEKEIRQTLEGENVYNFNYIKGL